MRKFSKFFPIGLSVTLLLPFLLFPLANLEAATTGLLAAYSFDAGSGSTAVDASGNNYTATITGASWTTAGKYNSALSFDGSSAFVKSPNITLPAAFTFMAWVNNPSDQPYETIVTVGEYRDLYLGNGFITFYDGSEDYGFGSKLSNNVWHHVAVTYDGTNLRAYLNGASTGNPQASKLFSRTEPIQTGAWLNQAGADDYFSGLIDEVRVYNWALSQGEIQTDMNNSIGTVTPTPTPTTTATPQPTPTPTSNGGSGGSGGGGGGGGAPPPNPTPTVTPLSGSRPKPADYGLREGYTVAAYGSNDPDIYIINDAGFKRLFLNPVIFGFYGHLGGFQYVKKINPEVRDVFETSGLFRNCETNNPKVYAVEVTGEDNGILHHVNIGGNQAVAEDPQFFNKVFCININEFNWYTANGTALGPAYTALNQVPKYSRK